MTETTLTLGAINTRVKKLEAESSELRERRKTLLGNVAANAVLFDALDWRVEATLRRLVGNIPSAAEELRFDGQHNLAVQPERDAANLVGWLERGGLPEAAEGDEPPLELTARRRRNE